MDFQHVDRVLLAELGIPDDYGTDPELVRYTEASSLVEVGPNIVGREQHLTPESAAAWQAMQNASEADDVQLVLVSGFRSVSYQAGLIRNKLAAGQEIDAVLKTNVAPGYSQHHTGNALDIATPGCKPLLEEFEDSAAFTWLQDNAAQFGFSLSYPRNNPEGVIYEPWHWYRAENV
ncbi:MAG: D-alanyl-D-alanine carboxypeptidase family protein [Gammaproteobacteria bacterium]|nr:D-alanyl-D-alanine carboxypeptidase family protein [Gammaproteobacteria bacterium]MCP4090174.1 D-alanyl-D-alanine carboxypeptidase family protein [Gammaproteobacteria bacterium]MCP4277945.1 D-alanyl-D-alanine carboxypeptidase family protein [Gammaproteobacteria bacterium]MCP4832540.1 D-alanyl-D-alanine carboxypeptidase family protein [Gammaproteobacteria bacterium]MCP4928678.1 D-alanyl-D-alanine carboxypeptidase family protein [Gammaproteobacteria bacterium]